MLYRRLMHKQTDYRKPVWKRSIGYLPLLLSIAFLFATLYFYFFHVYAPVIEPPYLILVLNTVFLTLASVIVAFISARSYLRGANFNILLLGCAFLINGLAAFAAGWLFSFSANYTVTIYNTCTFVSSLMQTGNAVLISVGNLQGSPSTKSKLILSYFLSITFVAIVATVTYMNLMPKFFVEDTGATVIDFAILSIAIVLFAISSLLVFHRQMRTKSSVLYFCSIALALFAVGLFAVSLETSLGDPLGWIGKIAQYIGAIFFLIAVVQTNKQKTQAIYDEWAESFASDRIQLEKFFASLLNGFSYCKIITKNGQPTDYVFLAVNNAFEKMMGIEKHAIIGKRVTEVLQGIDKDPANWIEFYGEVALTGESARVENFVEPLKSWYSVSAYSPKKGYFVSIFEDITERKKTEVALRENEQLYHTIFDNSQDGFQLIEIIHNENGQAVDHKLLRINKAYERIIGVTAEFIIGKTAKSISPNCESYWFETPDRVSKTGATEHVELYNRDINKWLDCYYFPYSKDVVGTLFRDVTERKRLEKNLQDGERLAAIGQTAGMVGHDIRNPLQAITGDLYIIKEELKSKETDKKSVMESIDAIEENLSYINKIVSDLQDYTRPLKPNLRLTNLNDLLNDTLLVCNIPKNIEAEVAIPKELNIRTDPDHLKRALTNLVINAIQAMPNGGKVTVEAFNSQTKTIIWVSDTGVGIPEDVKANLFKPLFTTKSKGQGLGLAVVKRIVEGLNGTITFETKEGKGTKFIIELPSTSN
jgi:PAS domain S-box-containing protein